MAKKAYVANSMQTALLVTTMPGKQSILALRTVETDAARTQMRKCFMKTRFAAFLFAKGWAKTTAMQKAELLLMGPGRACGRRASAKSTQLQKGSHNATEAIKVTIVLNTMAMRRNARALAGVSGMKKTKNA